ncbi:energy transducer TonB [Pseudomonas floridensis]|uniref:Energy transducer TonB n=1 Tax=Pseudomonas floridensis TaxID=1958950 RepID=A0A1X0N150_9PSED|nr:energy transducer TonB [Pseudomonas floridensis]ORC57107.1 energy transducer TonB [Pseudomonas floridensis]
MPALLSSRRPPHPVRDYDRVPAVTADRIRIPATPLPAVAVPRVGVGHIVFACLIALVIHAAGLFWLHKSAPAQPLPPITQPMQIAMQMVAAPKPPVPAAPAVPTPPAEPPPPPTPAEPPKPMAATPKPAAPRPQAAKPQTRPSTVPKQTAEKQPPAATPQTNPTQPPVQASPAPNEPRTTAPIGRAGYLNNPPPVYPPAAARRHQQGTTLLRVHVLASGRPDQVEVAQSSGVPALDDAAKAAVRQWSFTPAKRGETPVDGWVNVPLAFTLAP